MGNHYPRFNPVPGGRRSDHSADADTGAESGGSPTRSGAHRATGMAAQSVSDTYRQRIIFGSGIAFAVGTGLTIYSIALGK